MKIETKPWLQIKRAWANKGVAQEIYTRQAEAPNGKACLQKFRPQHSPQENTQNQWRTAEKAILVGG